MFVSLSFPSARQLLLTSEVENRFSRHFFYRGENHGCELLITDQGLSLFSQDTGIADESSSIV